MTRQHPTPSERPGSPLLPADMPTSSTMPPRMRWLLLAVGGLVLAVVGWFAVTGPPREHRGGPQRPTQAPTSPTSSSGSRTVRVVEVPISLKEDLPSIEGLAGSPSTTLVVLGRVTAVVPFYRGGLASSRLTIWVERASDRSIAAGAPITVVRDGGLIPAALATSAAGADDVDYRIEGAANTRNGDVLLAFLRLDTSTGRQGGYAVVSSVHGLWVRDDTGWFGRLGHLPPGFQTSVDAATAVDLTQPR